MSAELHNVPVDKKCGQDLWGTGERKEIYGIE
jgi:hypothetical protein